MKFILILFVCANAFNNVYAQCGRTFMGASGDRYIIGERPYRVYNIGEIDRDSVDAIGGRYIYLKSLPDGPSLLNYYVSADQRVFVPDASKKLFAEPYRLCDGIGVTWKRFTDTNSVDSIVYAGIEELDVLGGIRLAQRFVTLTVFDGEWIATTEEFVIDTFGVVLIRDIHHGTESFRLLGAYLGGIYYGDPLPVSVRQGIGRNDTVRVIDRILHLPEGFPIDSTFFIYDLRGRVVFTGIPPMSATVNLATLPVGIFVVAGSDFKNSPRLIIHLE